MFSIIRHCHAKLSKNDFDVYISCINYISENLNEIDLESNLIQKLFDSNNNLMGIMVSKTNNDPSNLDKNDHEVDAISGATITGDGVSDMIKERIQHYVPFFNSLKNKQIALN